MSKMISVKRLRDNIKNDPKKINMLSRILPYQMSTETNEKVWNLLEKRMLMVRELQNKYGDKNDLFI